MTSWFARTGDDDPISCSCGWSGTGRELSNEPFEALLERSCPRCDAHLELASYPTEDEVRAEAEEGNAEALAMAATMGAGAHGDDPRIAERHDVLPDLPPGAPRSLEVILDEDRPPFGASVVVLSGETRLWEEPASWGDIDAARRLLGLLWGRYDDHIDEITVRADAALHYCGDRLRSFTELDRLVFGPLPKERSYFSDWRERALRCVCGWAGPAEGIDPELNIYESTLDFICPGCRERTVLAVQLPTLAQIEDQGTAGDEELLGYLSQVEVELTDEGFRRRDFGPWTKDLASWTERGTRFDLERVVYQGDPSYYLLSLGEVIVADDDEEAVEILGERYFGVKRQPPARRRRPARQSPRPRPGTVPVPRAKTAGALSGGEDVPERAYYGDWRSEAFVCECGWTGAGDLLSPEIEARDGALHFECPQCRSVLCGVKIPSLAEIEDAASTGNAEAMAHLTRSNPELVDDGFILRPDGAWTKDIGQWLVPLDGFQIALERIIPIKGASRYMAWVTQTVEAVDDDEARAMVEARYLSTGIAQFMSYATSPANRAS